MSDHPPKWNCGVCTYENDPYAGACAMCGSPRPGLVPAARDGMGVAAAPDAGDGFGVPIASDAGAGAVAEGAWQCELCHALNGPRDALCVHCFEPAPAGHH